MKPKPGKGKIEDRRSPPAGTVRSSVDKLTPDIEDTRDPPMTMRPTKPKGSGENDLGPNKLAPKPSKARAAAGRKRVSDNWGAWWETPAAKASRRSAKRKQG